ncbi:MAG: trypsin-like peptidase domain-containing protein [Candidatus Omnitrophica bacterium]|nr:trypsin-like peptidase domain-containing protein [Candidatus Omnitrophota bacterium]
MIKHFKCSYFAVLVLLCVLFPGRGEAASLNQEISLIDAAVKVFVTSNRMDYYRPWQSEGIIPGVGSGAIISGNRILTNAHVIADHTFIQVKKDRDPKKYTANVLAIGNDCDLALLEVDDPEFFKGVHPLEMGGLPKQQDSVMVIGYPQGGGKISITEGVVSRIEVTNYVQSSRQLLTVQIDAAINPGNSGGPVVQNGKLVGIAMQIFQSGENIGYMIPVPIIDHFLKDLKDGGYEGFPMLGIEYKNTENATLREFYGITDEGGVLVSKVLPFSPAYGTLREGDVILEVNGIPIGEDGTFPFRGNERLSMIHLITEAHVGDDVSIKIIREKKMETLKVHLKHFVVMIPQPKYFNKPPYFIYGGLVFTVLSTDLLYSWGQRWWEKTPIDFTYYAIGAGRLNEQEQEQIVVLLSVLPDDINIGYHEIGNEMVAKVNGEDIKSFEDFILIINKVKKSEPYTIIETQNKSTIILANKDIDEVNKQILKRNNIPYQCSEDVAQWLDKDNP